MNKFKFNFNDSLQKNFKSAFEEQVSEFDVQLANMVVVDKISADIQARLDGVVMLDVVDDEAGLPDIGDPATLYATKDNKLYIYDDVAKEYVIIGNGDISQYITETRGYEIAREVNDTYIHNQMEALADWSIEHNLGRFPNVTVIDSGDTVVTGDIEYIDANNIIAHFTAPFSGKAYLN